MFALTQDKLIMEIEKNTFNLILSIVKMSPFSLAAAAASLIKPSPLVASNKKRTLLTKSSQENMVVNTDNSNEDSELYRKLFGRCKEITTKLTNLGNEKHIQDKSAQRYQVLYFTLFY